MTEKTETVAYKDWWGKTDEGHWVRSEPVGPVERKDGISSQPFRLVAAVTRIEDPADNYHWEGRILGDIEFYVRARSPFACMEAIDAVVAYRVVTDDKEHRGPYTGEPGKRGPFVNVAGPYAGAMAGPNPERCNIRFDCVLGLNHKGPCRKAPRTSTFQQR